jgi:hypothetical protein
MAFRVTYRKIAITMVKHLPVDNDEDFISKVEYYTGLMERLPRSLQAALKAAYVYASKAPPEEREDYFQEYYLAAHKAVTRAKNKIINYEALATTAVTNKRSDIFDYLNACKRKPPVDLISLSDSLPGVDGDHLELGQTLYDNNDCINNMDSVYDAKRILQVLPPRIKHIILKRLNGEFLTNAERIQLCYYKKNHGHEIKTLAKIV